MPPLHSRCGTGCRRSSGTGEGPRHALSAQEVYRKVSGAVVTVAVDLDGGRMSVGTGVIFREDGYILTNHHVVAGGKSCTVLLSGGRPYAAKYIASDAGYDLAVLKINAEEALPFCGIWKFRRFVRRRPCVRHRYAPGH